jgi:hypothetical protein
LHSKQVKKQNNKSSQTPTNSYMTQTYRWDIQKNISSKFVSSPYLNSLPSCSFAVCASCSSPRLRPPATEEIAVEERTGGRRARLRSRLLSDFFHFLVILFLLSLPLSLLLLALLPHSYIPHYKLISEIRCAFPHILCTRKIQYMRNGCMFFYSEQAERREKNKGAPYRMGGYTAC